MTEPLVALRDVRVRRGGFTLSVDRWTVRAGTVVGVVGPNGCGKTTLLRLLPGLDPPDAGEVRIFGQDPLRHPVEVRSALGWMSDDLELYPLPLGRLLGMLAPLYGTWDADLVDRLVARFHLDLDARVDRLSKGYGSRVRLLLAAAFRPRVLVLDEPGTGLDLGGRLALLETLLEAVELDGTAVIVSSHQIADVERVADRLLVLKEGAVLAEGPTPRLVEDGRTLEETLVAMGAAG